MLFRSDWVMAITNLDPDSDTTPDCNHVVGVGLKSTISLTLTLILNLGLGLDLGIGSWL